MDVSMFARSFLIGLAIAAPVGPIGVLCIRRTLAEGGAAGFATGLGAATADATYGFIAGFGLTLISNWLLAEAPVIRLIGGSFLVYLGVRTLLSRPAERPAEAAAKSLLGAYGSALVLTLTNPLTILSFTGIFAVVGSSLMGRETVVSVVAGVFAGSAFWWLVLSGGTSLLRTRLDPRTLVWVNRVSGVVILAFGVGALVFAR